MSFDGLGLTPELLRAVADHGYTEPTPVQVEAIPFVLAGRDLLAGAQTGTGKTAAFVLPILQLLNANRPAPRQLPVGNGRPRGATGLPIRCLILTPTRELALQVEESVRTYGARSPVRSAAIYGGVGFDPQVRAIRSGPEIVVATPGRLLDHVTQRTIDLGSVEIVVLDEADRMLDMGFIRDIRRILGLLPLTRQNLLFSATFANEIRELAAGFLRNPAQVQIARRNSAVELIRQVVYPVDRERKRELLSHLIRSGRIDQALVFTRTKHGANRLAEQLARDGIAASAIHGNKSQPQRVRALHDFKAGRVAILVATEIAARGLDIDGLPHVVNFELPLVAQDYVHRIGRTGRAGLEGDAVSLVCVDEAKLLREIEDVLRHAIPVEVVPGFEIDRSIRPESIRRGPVAGPHAGARRPMNRDGRGPAGPAWGGGAPTRQRGRRPGGHAGPLAGTGIGHRPAQSNRGRPHASMGRHDAGVILPGERFGPRPQTTAHTPPFGRPSTTMNAAGRTIGAPARSEVGMAKHSKHERERRTVETERVKEIESAWVRSLPADRAAAFVSSVEAARSRGPQPRQPDMAPGTQPRPPRPGHEPRPPKEAPRSRRSY